MGKRKATPPAPAAVGDEGIDFAAMSPAELVRLWEGLFDANKEDATELFWESLMQTAKAEYREKARRAGKEDDDGDGEARFFEPWQPSKPGSAPAPPPPPGTVVLALRAPPHCAGRKTKRAAATPATGEGEKKPPATGEGKKKPRVL